MDHRDALVSELGCNENWVQVGAIRVVRCVIGLLSLSENLSNGDVKERTEERWNNM